MGSAPVGHKGFLSLTGPADADRKVLKFDGACGAEGCGITAFGGDEFYMPLRGGRYGIIFRSLAILSRSEES